MKINSQTNSVEHSGVATTTNFMIKASAKAFQILSANLYSDTALAVIRELISNAYDAHKRAGKADVPIHVHLPVAMDSELRIKDEGTGISHEGMHTLFVTLFDSDKTDSNNEIGGLGLGSKSPYSVTDQYHLRSVFMGVARRYTAYIQADGTPGLADIGPPETVDEPDGFEVIVPIDPDHAHRYHQRYATFSQAMPVQPISNCNVRVKPARIINSTRVDDCVVEIIGNPGDFEHSYDSPLVVMGIVPYAITGNQKYDLPEIFRDRGIVLRAPIGTFEVSPSREALSLGPKDYQKFHDLAAAYTESLEPYFRQHIASAANALEASTRFWGLHRSALRHTFSKFLGDSRQLYWKGYALPADFGSGGGLLEVPYDNLTVSAYRLEQTRKRVTLRAGHHVYRNSHAHLTPRLILWMPKPGPFRHMVDNDALSHNDVVWVITGDKGATDRFLGMYGLTATPVGKAVRAPRTGPKKESFGSFEYRVIEHGGYPPEESRQDVAAIEDLIALGRLFAGTEEPPFTNMKPFFPNSVPFKVIVPDSHGKAKAYLDSLRSAPSWAELMREHCDPRALASLTALGRLSERLDQEPQLRQASNRSLSWQSVNGDRRYPLAWVHHYKVKVDDYDEPLNSLISACLHLRDTFIQHHADSGIYGSSHLATVWPDYPEMVAKETEAWNAHLDCLVARISRLFTDHPALKELEGQNPPAAIINAYTNRKEPA